MSSTITSNTPGDSSHSHTNNHTSLQSKRETSMSLNHESSFFAKQMEVFLGAKYQQIYDCFFSIVKDRQLRRNMASSINSSIHSIDERLPYTYSFHGGHAPESSESPPRTDSDRKVFDILKLRKHRKTMIPKQAVQDIGDALYMPSQFSKNNKFYKEVVEKRTPEFEFRGLLSKLCTEFSQQICMESPYLESILKDLDNLNKIFASAKAKDQEMGMEESMNGSFVASPLRNEINIHADKIDKKLKENQQLKDKVKQLDQLTNEMRKNYYKDLITYKGPMKNWKAIQDNPRNPHLSERDQITVEFFNALEGVDPDLTDIINQRIVDIKSQCEKRIFDHVKYQQELLKRIHCMNRLSPNAYSMVNLSLKEVMQALAMMYQDTQVVWDEVHLHYGSDCFLPIIERDYGHRFAKDYTFLNQEIDKVKEEAQYQILEVQKQSQNEIQFLRRALDAKNQEIVHLKENQVQLIEKAKKDSYFHVEVQFKSKEAKIFQKYDQEKAELYVKIKDLERVNTHFDQILTKQSMKFSFMKLALLGSFHKLLRQIKQENNVKPSTQVIDQSINRLFDIIMGRTTQEIQILKQEYEKDLKILMDESNCLAVDLAESRSLGQQQAEKLLLLDQCLSDSQQEAQMYKSQVESMKEEQRKLEGEHGVIKRALENSERLCEGLEREKKRIEFELQRIAGNNINKYQSAFAEADLHRKKALNQISNAGAATMHTIYGQNQKTKGTQTNIKDTNMEVIALPHGQDLNMFKEKLKGVPVVTQTDQEVVVLTDQEYRKLLLDKGVTPEGSAAKKPKHSQGKVSMRLSAAKMKESLNGDEDEGSDDQNDKSLTRKRNQEVKTQEIQCELINSSINEGVGRPDTKGSFQEGLRGQEFEHNLSLGEWKNKYLSSRDKIAQINEAQAKQELKKLKSQDKQSLYKKLLMIEQELPPVYRRLWLGVWEKAGRWEELKRQGEILQKEEWTKVCSVQNQHRHTRNRAFQKDPITGKVFINLVELYREAKTKQIFTQKNAILAKKNLQPLGAEISVGMNGYMQLERGDELNEAIREYKLSTLLENSLSPEREQPTILNENLVEPKLATEKQFVSEGVQTDAPALQKFELQSRNNSTSYMHHRTQHYSESKHLRKSLRTQLSNYQDQSFENSRQAFTRHQKSRQQQITNYNSVTQSAHKDSVSPFNQSFYRKQSTNLSLKRELNFKEDPHFQNQQSIFEMPSVLQNSSYILKQDGEHITPRLELSSTKFSHQSKDFPSFTIYLNQPRVKISKAK